MERIGQKSTVRRSTFPIVSGIFCPHGVRGGSNYPLDSWSKRLYGHCGWRV